MSFFLIEPDHLRVFDVVIQVFEERFVLCNQRLQTENQQKDECGEFDSIHRVWLSVRNTILMNY
ncbi:MAG: hypothetical protein A2066_19115 [Bacteroidetes bacterium GWB2_41_8]|nr:MAG: hypothetical protein A2066_19115 [Bacteroidetes bacterium GWB2_41_8]